MLDLLMMFSAGVGIAGITALGATVLNLCPRCAQDNVTVVVAPGEHCPRCGCHCP
jgi:hypothetical protein